MQESPLNFFGSIGRAASSLFGGRSRRSKGRGRASMQGIGSIIGAKKESRGISLRDTLQRQTQQSNPSGIVEAAAGVTQPQSNFGLVNAAMSMQQNNLGLFPDQNITSPTVDPGIANNAVSAVAQQAQQAQVAQGTGLNTLTQGPSPVNPADIAQEEAANIYSGASFGNQAFTKKGSIIPHMIKK